MGWSATGELGQSYIGTGSTPEVPYSSAGSSFEVSPVYGPEPRDEAGHELAVAAVRGAEASAQLALFEGYLEGELSQIDSSEQEKSPATGEKGRAHDQGRAREVEGIAHVAVRPLHHQPLRDVLGSGPRRKQGAGEEQPRPTHLRHRPRPRHHRSDEQRPAEDLQRQRPTPAPSPPPRGEQEEDEHRPAPEPRYCDQVPRPDSSSPDPALPEGEHRVGDE